MKNKKHNEVINYVREMHRGQEYGDSGIHTYFYHLEAVVKVLIDYGYDDDKFIISGYLHDVVEDVEDVTNYDIAEKFGTEIGRIVYHVTDEDGENRKERKAKTLPKTAQNIDAIVVKLADRIANIEYSIYVDNNTRMYNLYLKEHDELKKHLYREEHDSMWDYIETLLNINKE